MPENKHNPEKQEEPCLGRANLPDRELPVGYPFDTRVCNLWGSGLLVADGVSVAGTCAEEYHESATYLRLEV
jgi:hypothetical protein